MEKFYSCNQVAELFGVKRITVWEWIRVKKLKASRIGRDYRVSESDLKEFYQSRRTVSA